MAILKSLIVNGVTRVIGDITAAKIIKQGGVSSLFLKADGSVDSNAYIVLTSTARPGVTKLYRRETDDGYNVLTLWDGTYWILLGYYEDTYHAPCRVSYADNADTVDGYHYSDIILSNGKNLIRNYDIETTSSSYLVWSPHIMTETVANGEQVTITIEYSLSSNATKTWLKVYTGGGYAHIASFDSTPGLNHNTQSVTVTMRYSDNYNDNSVCLFYGPASNSGTCTIHKVKVERGNRFTGWSPAPEDLITTTNIGRQSVNYASSAGSATTASSVDWSGITNKPSSFTPSDHTHSDTFKILNKDDYINLSFRDTALSQKASEKYIECYDGTGGWWNWMANKWIKAGSSDDYVLLGGGGHKAVSDFATVNHIHSYLPLSGGTITGKLTINTEFDRSLILDEPTGEKYHIISFKASGEEYSYLCAYSSDSNNILKFNSNTIYHSGNLTKVSQLINDAGYVTTDTTYSTATSDTLGLVKIGYAANGKNYPVLLSNGQMYVNVPWTDTNTTYNFSGTTFYSGDSNTAEHDANNAIKNGHYYYSSNGPLTTLGASSSSGALYVQSHSDSWVAQIAQDYRNGKLFVRCKRNGTWQDWKRIAITGEYLPANGGTSDYANYLIWESASISSYARKIPISLDDDEETTYTRFRAVYSDSLTYRTDTNTISSNISGNAATATLASAVTVLTSTYTSPYNILFHSGNNIYSSSNLKVTPNNGNVTSAGNFYANSDIRYKNITDLYYSLSSKIALLPIFKYTWINREDSNQHIGSSALSVMDVMPELVTYDDKTDFYSLDYATLGAVAGISACREVEMLKLRIQDLEQEIIFLKSKYNG